MKNSNYSIAQRCYTLGEEYHEIDLFSRQILNIFCHIHKEHHHFLGKINFHVLLACCQNSNFKQRKFQGSGAR